MAQLFKGKFLSGIKNCTMLEGSSTRVMHYLGRYTHRIATSSGRILRMDKNTVTIQVKDYKCAGEWKELTLSGIEFVRRFLLYALPAGFQKI